MFNKKELASIRSAIEYSHERAVNTADHLRKSGEDKEIVELLVQACNDRRRLLEKIEKLLKEPEVVPG